jgi:hypothetical protein
MNKAEADLLVTMITRFDGILTAHTAAFEKMLNEQRAAQCDAISELVTEIRELRDALRPFGAPSQQES